MTTNWMRLVVLAGALAPVLGCGSQQAKKKPKLAELERVPRLETISPERQPTFTVRREYTATIEPYEKADLYPQVRGVVQSLSPNADIGRMVLGEAVRPRAACTSVGVLGNGTPLLAAAVLLAGRTDAEVLVTLAIPDVLAERENKRALLELARQTRAQALKARDVAAREVRESEAQIKRAEAEAEFRNSHYTRMVRLAASDTVQKQMAEESRLQYKSALAAQDAAHAQLFTKHARLAAAEGEILVAEGKVRVAQAELERLDALVGFATIRAPFTGIVTKRWIDRGAAVKDFGTPLLTVMRTDVVRVLIDVPERDAPYIRAASDRHEGSAVVLRVPALQEVTSSGEFPGVVNLTAGSLDPVTRTMRAEVLLPNPRGLLRPQMSGTAVVVVDERKDVFTVPSSALLRQGGKAFVYCVADVKGDPPRGIVRQVEVETGIDDGRAVEIRRGLSGREQIITKGNGVVRQGDFAIPVSVR